MSEMLQTTERAERGELPGGAHGLVAAQTARTPDATAVAWGGGTLSYAALDRRAAAVAAGLRARGVGAEARVGVALDRSPEMVAAVLGVLKAGAAFVPLDPAYPAERLAYMVADAGVRLALTAAAAAGAVSAAGAEPLLVDALDACWDDAEAGDGSVDPDALAYVIYTSGSTGRPKGVGVTHRGLRNTALAFNHVLRVREGSRFLQFASPSFDASVCELFVALAAGAEVHLAPREALLPGPGLVELLERRAITHAILPPSALALLPPAALPSLETLIVAGEACAPELVRRWAPGRRFVNAYGPTEAAICATAAACAADGRTPPIGPAIDGATAHVLDAALRPADEGELCVGGEGVARGYLGRPALTAERFLPDPYAPLPGARMYRTGDRVRRRADGALEFVGRMDDQVKVRGHRVEPGEVADALAAHPALAHAAVAARPDPAGGSRLVAYFVAKEAGRVPAVGELRAFLARALPEPMVPSAFVALDALPLTPNGKVDRAALPEPPAARPALAAPWVAPRTDAERAVAEVCAEVLGIAGVGAEDGFFELGGHSLAATRVASRLRARGMEVPLAAVLGGATVAEVARAAEASAAAPAFPPILPLPRGGDFPPSASQERVWFLTQLAPDNRSYHAHAALRFRGALDVGALERALGGVIARHEIFRTTFPTVDGRPVQRIHAPWEVRLPVVDFRDVPAAGREAAVQAWMDEDFTRLFDLSRLPLLRWTLLRTDDDEHRLVHVEHHAIHDGWSFNVFLRDLTELYRAEVEGRAAELPPLEVQFADFCAWQRAWVESDAARAQLDFWRRTLAGSPPLLELPTDRPRPAVQRFRGAAPRFHLSGALYHALRELGHGEGATLFMAMLAGFDALLSRWSGEEDLSVGTGIAVRRQRETEGMMGMFVNSLVLRTDLSGDPTFRELLARVRRTTLDAYARQDVPFEAVVDAVRPDRTLAHNPLFQVMFSFHDSTVPGLALPGVEVALDVALSNRSAKFDLNVVAIPHAEQRGARAGEGGEADDGITLVWEHDSDLFDPATIQRMFRHYRALLEAAVADPDTPLSRLAMLEPAEAEAMLAAGRATRAFPVAERIHQRFERVAAARPHAPALTFAGETLSYGELNARANRLAHRLIALGVGPETRVGVCLERSAELVVAILAVLKAGGGYVPLDPAYPAERIAFVLDDAAVPVLVTDSRLAASLPAHGAATLALDADAALAAAPDTNPAVAAPADALAYVIYTSGSTGKPKGVEVTHANVLRLFEATDGWFAFGEGDVWTLFHSCAFDFSVWEIWGALLHGGRLVVVPWLVTRSPDDFHRLLVDEGVTILNQTPSAFRTLIDADLRSGVDPAALRLRRVIFGGEALDPQALRPWFDRHGDARPRLVNMYGITETTVHVTWREITRADAERASSPIGVPIPDLSLYLLDRHLRPVPCGVAGELFVGGAGVARGYLGRPELTAERFVRDPFSADPAARLYRSGDLARRRADGEVEYLGRADQQVKLRGFRIETGEVEAAVASHPAVASAAVVLREDAPGEKRLVAYHVVREGEPAPAAAELRAHVSGTLPEHMVPAAFVALGALPLTAHGKLDRRALPAPEEADGAAAAGDYAPPATPAEAALAAAWREVLGIERVGIDDNYFAVGGDSIRSVRVIAAARRHGLSLTLPQLFRHQTVRELAAVAELAPSLAAAPARAEPFALLAPGVRETLPDDVEDAYPASRVQLGMLYHTERDPGSVVYLNVNSYRVHTRFDAGAMRRALARLAERHPVLRTSFDLAASPEPLQRVHRRVELPLEVTDLRGLSGPEADAWFEREKGRGFDWTVPPLLRFRAHLLGDGSFRLVLAEHHAVLDGWSVATMMTELLQLFVAFRDGAEDPAGPPPAARFRDFVALERETIHDAGARAFWRAAIAGAPVAALPPREGGDAPDLSTAPALWVDLPPDTAAGLRRVADRAGVPLKTVLLAAHLRVTSLLSGCDDVVTGYVTSGRPETEDGERVLGLFLNTVPLRLRMRGGSWLELVRRAWEAEEAVVPHRRFPLAEIVRDAGARALFEVGFSFTHFHVYRALAAGGVRMEGDRFFQKTEVPLIANATVSPATGALGVRLEYDPARLSAAQVRRVAGWYARAFAALAARPDARWDAETLLDAGEAARLAALWNGPVLAHDAIALHHGFERQARRTPDAVAVRYGGERLTYAELERKSAALALRLRRLGARPEARVAVALERSVDMVVAVVAIARTGAAYVPLDPAYPAARIAWVVENAAAVATVTSSALAGRFAGAPGKTVLVDAEVDEDASAFASDWGGPDTAAVIIYTSGSTGRPKGVVVTHAGLASLFAELGPRLRVRPGDVLAALSTLAFDVGIFEVWLPLWYGAQVAVLPREAAADPALLARLLRESGARLVQATPATWQTLVDAGWEGAPGLTVLAAGEALAPQLAAALRGRVAELLNMYGPTENTIYSTIDHVDGEWTPMPVGRPVANACVRILDPRGRPVPPGVAGEVCIGGACVTRGYLGRPALTAERFVPDPAGAPGSRIYRSGDLGRFRADGRVEYLGRFDFQVKIRGFRIETGEIEGVILEHPGVERCVVTAHADPRAGTRLAAHVVPRPGAALGAAGLRRHLRTRLPEHMVPAAVAFLDALPFTPNGKVDRLALPAPDFGAGDGAPHVAPRTATERAVAAVWAEELGVERVGVEDEFLALGGHSLLAMRALARMRAELRCELGLRTFLEARTLGGVAAAIDAEHAAGAAMPEPELVPRRARRVPAPQG